MKLKGHMVYGQNDCGKTTLMRAIADGSVDGFPDPKMLERPLKPRCGENFLT